MKREKQLIQDRQIPFALQRVYRVRFIRFCVPHCLFIEGTWIRDSSVITVTKLWTIPVVFNLGYATTSKGVRKIKEIYIYYYIPNTE
jgi:hypothetical protein